MVHRKIKTASLLLSIALIAGVFQNCGEGFDSNGSTSNSSTGGNDNPEDPPVDPMDPPVDPPIDPPPPGGVTAFTYTQFRQQILVPRCIGCHGPGDATNLSTYAGVKASIPNNNPQASSTYARMADGTMPPGQPYSFDVIDKVALWIMMGAPNN